MKSKKNFTVDAHSVSAADNVAAEVTAHSTSATSTSRRGFLKTAGIGVAALTAGAVLPTGMAPEAAANRETRRMKKGSSERKEALIRRATLPM